MKRQLRGIAMLVLLGTVLGACVSMPDDTDEKNALQRQQDAASLINWVNAQRVPRMQSMDKADVASLRDVLQTAFRKPKDMEAALRDAWSQEHFVVEKPVLGANLLAVREPSGAVHGWGVWVARMSPSAELMIQAPHSDTDLNTGLIAAQWATQRSVAITMWNTVRRTEGGEGGSSDLARISPSLFTVAAEEFIRANPAGRVVQVHGMHQGSPDEGPRALFDVIISAGSSRGSAAVQRSAACLRAQGIRAGIYGSDVEILGGTRNATGQVVRALQADAFLHLELGADLRKRMAGDMEFSLEMLACLT